MNCDRQRERPRHQPQPVAKRLQARGRRFGFVAMGFGFALAPDVFSISELRGLYSAALGYRIAATNLQRVLARRGLLEPTG